jgi:hypothetical protein
MPLRLQESANMGRTSVFGLVLAIGYLLVFETRATTAACTREDFAKAVNGAGAALRKLNTENGPRLQAKMRDLKTKMGWPELGYEERALQALQDERLAALDAEANERLARIDALGTIDPAAEPDCARLDDLAATSLELQTTVKTRTSYMITRIDQMLGIEPASQPKARPAAKPSASPPAPKPPQTAKVEPPAKADPRPKVQPQPPPPRDIVVVAPPDTGTPVPPGPPLSPDEDGYTIDEIRAASAGFFGQVSANLGAVIEHVFRKSGRPTAYVLGTEGGGAFLAGVRYGKGTLYLRNGGTQPVHWHGPSLGVDVGGEGSKTLFLVYKLREPEQLFSSFTGIDGTAYLVGGVGATLVTNGKVVMAPIRSGLGLRLGASIGYIRFTSKATWNPF